MHFNWIDLVVILFIIRGIYRGIRHGFSGELLRFVGVVCAVLLSFRFYEPCADWLIEKYELEYRIAIACSFAGIFFVVMAVFYLVNRMARRLTELPVIATVERIGGALLGGAKAFLFACIVLIILALLKVDFIVDAISTRSYFGALAISSVPGIYQFAVRVYPPAQSERAEEVIEKLPPVERAPGLNMGRKEREAEETDYIIPEREETGNKSKGETDEASKGFPTRPR
jgi:membrane protein required for colicin V production